MIEKDAKHIWEELYGRKLTEVEMHEIKNNVTNLFNQLTKYEDLNYERSSFTK